MRTVCSHGSVEVLKGKKHILLKKNNVKLCYAIETDHIQLQYYQRMSISCG